MGAKGRGGQRQRGHRAWPVPRLKGTKVVAHDLAQPGSRSSWPAWAAEGENRGRRRGYLIDRGHAAVAERLTTLGGRHHRRAKRLT